MKKVILACCLLGIANYLSAQSEDSIFIRRLADEILLNGKAYDNLRVLTKQIRGRLAGSPQMVKAEQWGLQTMKKANPDTAWLQECMVPHWVRGGKDKAMATYKGGKKTLDVVALGNSIGSQKPLQASVIAVNSFDELEQKKNDIKGKVVFYNYHFNPTFIKTFLAYGDAVKYRTQGPSRAAKYGAKAVIVRSMSESTDNNPHTGATSYDNSLPKIPAVAIGLKDADWLDSTLKSNTVSVTLETYGKFLSDTTGHNVIGELRGSEFPNEYITVGGHLDSWDVNEGAHDDGTGVVQTIEILRTLHALAYKPRHTIRFVLFANEENGTRGANEYAREAKAKNEQHIFALESDAGGFTPRGFALEAPVEQVQKLKSWKPLLEPYGTCEFISGAGTDVEPLRDELGTAVGELLPDSQRYFDLHHARNDVFEAVNKRELELGAINMAALIYLVDKYGL